MPPAAKISISISAEDLAWAKKRARTGARSLSAVVSEALRRQRQTEARVELLADVGVDDVSDADVARIRAELRSTRTVGRRGKGSSGKRKA